MRRRVWGLALVAGSLLACAGYDELPATSVEAGASGAAGNGGGGAGNGGSAGAGGDVANGGSVTAPVPTPPAPPMPPSLTPCPEGWSETKQPNGTTTCHPDALPSPLPCPDGWSEETDANGVVTCEPATLVAWTCPAGWSTLGVGEGTSHPLDACAPPALPSDCPAGTMPVVGKATCQPIGDPCPSGAFPEGLPAGASIVWVNAGATGGDGSQAKPFGAIQDAVAAAPAGAIVAIAKGTYPEVVFASNDVTLWGACVAGVTIVGPDGDPTKGDAVVSPGAGKLSIRNVHITGNRLGTGATPGASLDLSGVWIDGTVGAAISTSAPTSLDHVLVSGTRPLADGTFGVGMYVTGGTVAAQTTTFDGNRAFGVFGVGNGAHVTFTDVAIARTLPVASDMTLGRGMELDSGATAEVVRTLFENNVDMGFTTWAAGSWAKLTDVVVRGTDGRAKDGDDGVGIWVEQGSSVDLERVVVDGNRSAGLLAMTGASVTAKDLVVHGTLPRKSDSQVGFGVFVRSGSALQADRTYLDANHAAGFAATEPDTKATLADLFVTDTATQASSKTQGSGLDVENGASVDLSRALVEGNHEWGIIASGSGGSIAAHDVVVRHTLPRDSDLQQGYGLYADKGATLAAERTLVDASTEAGVYADGSSTTVKLRASVVRGTLPAANQSGAGHGLAAFGATLALDGVLVERNHTAGLLAAKGANVTIADSVVRDTQPEVDDGQHGEGVLVNASTVALDRTILHGNRSTGLFASGAGAQVSAADLVVEATDARASDGTLGRGVEIGKGAKATLQRALFDGNTEGGVFVPGGDVTLEDVVVQRTKARPSDMQYGIGIGVMVFGSAAVTRAVVDGNRAAGVLAYDEGSKLALRDVVVEATDAQASDGQHGVGLGISGADVTVERAVFDHNRSAGIAAGRSTTHVSLVDVDVRSNDAQPDGQFGNGIDVGDGANATLDRVRVSSATVAGLFVHDAGTSVTATDLDVAGTRPAANDGTFGIGVGAFSSATLKATRLRVQSSTVAAVLLQSNVDVTLDACTLTGTRTGKFLPDLGGNPVQGAGDGVVALSGSKVAITGASIDGCARAGILFAQSSGSLSMTSSTGNSFGLVLQGGSMPTYDATCSFAGNATRPVLTDGDLPVPSTPVPVPSTPPAPDAGN